MSKQALINELFQVYGTDFIQQYIDETPEEYEAKGDIEIQLSTSSDLKKLTTEGLVRFKEDLDEYHSELELDDDEREAWEELIEYYNK